MLSLNGKNILMACQPIDFRLSIDGLVRMVTQNNGLNCHDGSIYVFYNKNRNRIKLLFWDKNGFVLYYKKLDAGIFFLSKDKNGISTITHDQLEIILTGYNPKFISKQVDFNEQ